MTKTRSWNKIISIVRSVTRSDYILDIDPDADKNKMEMLEVGGFRSQSLCHCWATGAIGLRPVIERIMEGKNIGDYNTLFCKYLGLIIKRRCSILAVWN